jgi:protein involved in temperature-dependent protein secretion
MRFRPEEVFAKQQVKSVCAGFAVRSGSAHRKEAKTCTRGRQSTPPSYWSSVSHSLAMISSGRYRFLDMLASSSIRSEKHSHISDRFEGREVILVNQASHCPFIKKLAVP